MIINYIKTRFSFILQALAHHIYLFILLFFYDGDRHLMHYLYIVVFSLLLDLGLQKIYKKDLHFNISVWITCSTCYMLMVTKHLVWPYYVACFVGIAAKYIITLEKNHVFNPGNLGLLFAMCIFPDVAMMSAGQWLGSVPMMIFFLVMGIVVSTAANRWILSLVYISTFVLLRFLKHEMTGINLYFLIGPILSVSGFIFTFHMSTDPKTSPDSKLGQVIYALALAFLDFYFREMQILFSSVLALVLVCALRAIWIGYGSPKMKEIMRETVVAKRVA